MASPVDAGRATYAAAATQSHPVTMPASIAADDLLVMFLRVPRNVTISLPAGWSRIITSQADADDDQQEVWIKTATGSEGSTQTVTLVETSRRLAAITWRITGAGSYVISTDAISTTSIDPPNVSWTGTRDILAIAMGGGSNALTRTGDPSGYSNGVGAITPGNTTDGTSCSVMGATKQISAVTSEDPGAFSFTGSVFATISWTLVLTDVSLNPYRVTRDDVDVAVQPDTGNARVTRTDADIAVKPTDGKARITRDDVDVAIKGDSKSRFTQIPVDVAFHETFPRFRTTQVPADVAIKAQDQKLRVTQVAVDVAKQNRFEFVDIRLIW